MDAFGHITTTSFDVLQRPYAVQLPDATIATTLDDLVGNRYALGTATFYTVGVSENLPLTPSFARRGNIEGLARR